jgi:hypothetical protein
LADLDHQRKRSQQRDKPKPVKYEPVVKNGRIKGTYLHKELALAKAIPWLCGIEVKYGWRQESAIRVLPVAIVDRFEWVQEIWPLVCDRDSTALSQSSGLTGSEIKVRLREEKQDIYFTPIIMLPLNMYRAKESTGDDVLETAIQF